MRRIFFPLLALALFAACSPRPSVAEQAALLGADEFSEQGWRVAGAEERGAMLHSFLARHASSALDGGRVRQLLGEPDAYVDYDENLAYVVGPDTVESEYGRGYRLVFYTDKANGSVMQIAILPPVRQ